jgi:hypothetical protein
MEGQSIPLQPLAEHLPDSLRILPLLEADDESSGPGEFHPQALTDPDVRLAPHPALMIRSMV